MTKQELLEQLKTLREEQEKEIKILQDFYHNGNDKEGRKHCKKCDEIGKKIYDIIYQLEVANGYIYDNEKWVNEIFSDYQDSLEDARQDLLNKVSKLNGVKKISMV